MKTIAILAAALLLLALPAYAEIINVPDDFETIQAGIDAAEDGDTVLVQPGTYYENLHFRGENITLASLFLTTGNERYINETIIDAEENGERVIRINQGESEECILTGFTIQNGIADADHHGGGSGGGISCESSDPTIHNMIIKNNYAFTGGGLVFCASSSLVHDILIFDNRTDEPGGAINCTNSVISLERVTITNNIAESGGAIIVANTELTVIESILWENSPNELTFHPPDTGSTIFASYSDIQGGIQAIANQGDNHIVELGEGNIDADPLFADPDNGDFHLTEDSPCIDAGDPESPEDPDGTRADMGAFYFDQQINYPIPLHAGWQMVSSPVDPRNPDMESVWADIVGRNNLLMVKDALGWFYAPEENYNGMGDWDVRYGYFAKLNEPDTLVIPGQAVAVDTPIPLQNVWSIVSYFPEENLTAPEAFANIEEALVMAKDDAGRFYHPEWNYNGMDLLTRGEGYQVKISRPCDLVWNVRDEGMMMGGGNRHCEESRLVGMTKQSPAYSAYEGIASPDKSGSQRRELPTKYHYTMTGRNMSILIVDCGLLISESVEVGAFTTDGLCVGSAVIKTTPPYSPPSIEEGEANAYFHPSIEEGETMIGVAVWGDDPTTEKIDGAMEGETLHFRIWDGSHESTANVEWLEGDGIYQTDAFSVVSLSQPQSTPLEFNLAAPYPNPFNSSIKLNFTLPQRLQVHLMIYDLSGREVACLVNDYLEAGRYDAVWDARNMPNGIYFAHLSNPNTQRTLKLTLIK